MNLKKSILAIAAAIQLSSIYAKDSPSEPGFDTSPIKTAIDITDRDNFARRLYIDLEDDTKAGKIYEFYDKFDERLGRNQSLTFNPREISIRYSRMDSQNFNNYMNRKVERNILKSAEQALDRVITDPLLFRIEHSEPVLAIQEKWDDSKIKERLENIGSKIASFLHISSYELKVTPFGEPERGEIMTPLTQEEVGIFYETQKRKDYGFHLNPWSIHPALSKDIGRHAEIGASDQKAFLNFRRKIDVFPKGWVFSAGVQTKYKDIENYRIGAGISGPAKIMGLETFIALSVRNSSKEGFGTYLSLSSKNW